MKRIACTIVSANYLHFGWTLAESFLNVHPEEEFHLLLVDRLPADFVSRNPRVQILEVEALHLSSFLSLAFKYDILELNTNVKPSFLKYLFSLGADTVIYFDPDIYIFQPLTPVYDALEKAPIVLTPHILSPTPDAQHVCERDVLSTGVFNLGFVAVANTAQGHRFLDWWEERCLHYGYHDLRSGLFVDQKWANLAPCLFEGVHILRHPGCNVAYWNLPERSLSSFNSGVIVNGEWPLVFFHYSGYRTAQPDQLSSKLRVPQAVDRALAELLRFYGERLTENGAGFYQAIRYAYASFSNGSLVSSIARRLYSATLDRWGEENPFDANSRFYAALKSKRLLSRQDQSGGYSSSNLPASDWRIVAINRILFFLPRLIGGDRYSQLMKYLSFICILRNQGALLSGAKAGVQTKQGSQPMSARVAG